MTPEVSVRRLRIAPRFVSQATSISYQRVPVTTPGVQRLSQFLRMTTAAEALCGLRRAGLEVPSADVGPLRAATTTTSGADRSCAARPPKQAACSCGQRRTERCGFGRVRAADQTKAGPAKDRYWDGRYGSRIRRREPALFALAVLVAVVRFSVIPLYDAPEREERRPRFGAHRGRPVDARSDRRGHGYAVYLLRSAGRYGRQIPLHGWAFASDVVGRRLSRFGRSPSLSIDPVFVLANVIVIVGL